MTPREQDRSQRLSQGSFRRNSGGARKGHSRRLRPFALALTLGLAAPAFAGVGADISSPAWTNHPLKLQAGPGDDYETKAVLPGGLRIYVDRCSGLWCRVHKGRAHGYAFLYPISFGHGPNSIWWPPRYRHPHADRFSW